MSSIKDIVRLSGTSLGTVSRVLNNSGYVGKETRERVEKAIRELGYEPNAGARQIRSGRSGLVGILLPSLDVPFFGILAQSIEQALFESGYHSLICNTAESEAHEARYVATLVGQKVDGVIVVSAVSEVAHLRRLAEKGIPIVAVDRALDGLTDDLVSVDHLEGGRMMARHLLSLGHTRIAVIGAPEHSAPIVQRIAGIKEELARAGLSVTDIRLGAEQNLDLCYDLAKEVLSGPEKPTAVIGTTDIAAIGAIHAAHDLGLEVPTELSVIGFDNLPAAAHVLPRLTTIAQPIAEAGHIAAELLLHKMNPKDFAAPDLSVLQLKLVDRHSTARAPQRASAEIE